MSIFFHCKVTIFNFFFLFVPLYLSCEEMIKLFEEVGEKNKGETKDISSSLDKEKNKVEVEAKNETKDTKSLETSNKKSSNENKIAPNGKRKMSSSPNSTDSKKKKNATTKAKTPLDYINDRVSKWFDEDLYFGTVTGYDKKEKLWKILYDDDDEEEFEKKELIVAIQLYQDKKYSDPKLKKKGKGKLKKKVGSGRKLAKTGHSEAEVVDI